MNNSELKKAYDGLTYANQTLSLIANGEISSDKYGKTLETIIRQVTKAQDQILKVNDDNASVANTLTFERNLEIENYFIKIEALFNAAINLNEEDEEELKIDNLTKMFDVFEHKLKPAIFIKGINFK